MMPLLVLTVNKNYYQFSNIQINNFLFIIIVNLVIIITYYYSFDLLFMQNAASSLVTAAFCQSISDSSILPVH